MQGAPSVRSIVRGKEAKFFLYLLRLTRKAPRVLRLVHLPTLVGRGRLSEFLHAQERERVGDNYSVIFPCMLSIRGYNTSLHSIYPNPFILPAATLLLKAWSRGNNLYLMENIAQIIEGTNRDAQMPQNTISRCQVEMKVRNCVFT